MTQPQTSVEDFHLLIVSDNRLLADAAGAALCEETVITSYEHTRLGEELSHLRKTQLEPQVVILDACCFEEQAELFSSIGRLTEELPESQFVVLAYDADPACVTGCIVSGASGFVLKTESLGDLVATIKALKNGHSRCCDQVVDAVLARIRELSGSKNESANNTDAELTEREIEILQLVDEGLLNKEIARRLGIALSTVKNHLHSAFEKLQVVSRRQAVSQAIALGVLQCHADAVA
jgi:DNA-binding NarL/FixJ family response regulator